MFEYQTLKMSKIMIKQDNRNIRVKQDDKLNINNDKML